MEITMYRRNLLSKTCAWLSILGFAAAGAAWSQTGSLRKAFEVASIKQAAEAGPIPTIYTQPGGLLVVHNASLRQLVQQAYGVYRFQVLSGPSWTDRGIWDISARASNVSARMSDKELEPFLRSLLADRFSLKVHTESREAPTYALLAPKGDSKMKQNTADPRPRVDLGRGFLRGTAVPMGRLANLLGQMLDRPVSDKTGLTGNYDMYFEWTPEVGEGTSLFGPSHDAAAASDDNKSRSLFTALQEQLGLRLQGEKGQTEMIVIDQAEKASEN
jgi:uncharacterized protein (TIGR03435 family)